MTDKSTRCGHIALIGAPNVGKSTLLNAMVGSKIAIVSRKVQTTRARIVAIGMVEEAQLVFVDTPGIFRPRRRLDRAMVAAAWAGAADADVICFLVDAARGLDAEGRAVLDRLEHERVPVWLIINKVDLVPKPILLELTKTLNERLAFARTYMISALQGSGTDTLRKALAEAVPEGPWHYPPDQLADIPERLLAAEITREKIYDRLHEELPYATTVETETWEEKRDGSVRIGQVIFVEREGQRAIVLGHRGETVKLIGATARMELEALFDRKVHLFLFVKVRENWGDDPERYRAMGLDFGD